MMCVTGRPWTPEETAWLRAFGPYEPGTVLAVQLERSPTAIHRRSYTIKAPRRKRPWTRQEENRLLMMWGQPLPKIATELARTQEAVYQRASRLGLHHGCPPGYEYLTAAAKRTGFGDTCVLRRILRWAGVNVRSAHSLEPAHHCHHIVDPEAVDRAVKAWLNTETPVAAARRLGVAPGTVLVHLKRSGLRLPPKPTYKFQWRIPSKTIDRAMAMVVRRGRQLVAVREAA